MQKPAIPANEQERLTALQEYNIMDTLPEEALDHITRLASEICQAPIALISLVDQNRQWFKSRRGMEKSEMPRDIAFCAHAILTPQKVLIVPDSREDERFANTPLVTAPPHVVFYTGVPLVNPEGFPLGTLCVMDTIPRELSANQIEALQTLANQTVALFELRKKNTHLHQTQVLLETKNRELEQFARIVSHDLKVPLNNIILSAELLKKEYHDKLEVDGVELLEYLTLSSHKLRELVDGILAYCRGDNLVHANHEEIDLLPFLRSIAALLNIQPNCTIHYPNKAYTLHTNKIALEQLFINLISNSIKYNDKEHIVITIDFAQNNTHYSFSVTDNGRGIHPEDQSKIFDLFANLGHEDRYGKQGTGIGLSTVKKLVEKQGGTIRVISELGKGSTFHFTIAK